MPIANVLKRDGVIIRRMLYAQQNDEHSAERTEIEDRRRRMDMVFKVA
jgi:hypothetical protein